MPLALIFAFYLKMGVFGLWFGFSIACIVLDIGFVLIITCGDWHKISDAMAQRLENEENARKAHIRSS